MDRALLTLSFVAAAVVSAITGCEAPTLGEQTQRHSGKNTLSEECADLPSGALTSDGSRCPDPNNETDDSSAKKEQAGTGAAQRTGITTCQPAFATVCKPQIIFTNGDPMGRGKVFTDAIPDVEKAEQEIACVACSILYRSPDEIPNLPKPQIKIILDTHGGAAQAALDGDQIQFDLDYIAGWKDQPPEVIKQEMLGVLQHETVHLYQNYGTYGTGEGVADLVRAQTGYYQKYRWQSEGTWKDAYTASGNFYSWLTGPSSFHSAFYSKNDPDFPCKLNKALAGTDDTNAFDAAANIINATFGRTPEDLWDEYQRTAGLAPQTAQTGN